MLKYSATQIFTGYKMLDNSHVLLVEKDGTIINIVPKTEVDATDIIELDGILTPGFINAHCHLELSHLYQQINEQTGLTGFIKQVIQKRNFNKDEIYAAIATANEYMQANGIVAVGDICNTTDTLNTKTNSSIYYHNFIESFGFLPQLANERFSQATDVFNEFEKKLPHQNSIVPHAPYSVSEPLFQQIKQHNQQAFITSIHNQECKAENDFFINKTGEFVDFYRDLNTPTHHFNATQKTSLQSVAKHLGGQNILLVHSGYMQKEDASFLHQMQVQNNQTYWLCICALANKYIGNNTPSEEVIKLFHNQIVLGTDSLASNHQLSILSEIKYLLSQFGTIFDLSFFLKAATINGAKALGIDNKFGSFTPKKQPGIFVIKNLDCISKILTLF